MRTAFQPKGINLSIRPQVRIADLFFFEPPYFFFFLFPQIVIGSFALLQKFTPPFKILDPHLPVSNQPQSSFFISMVMDDGTDKEGRSQNGSFISSGTSQ